MSEQRRPSRIKVLLVAVLVMVLAGVAFLAWQLLIKPGPGKAADMTAALEANTRGLGHMDRFEYPQAIEAFEKAVDNAPDWPAAKINLALALVNEIGKTQSDGGEIGAQRERMIDHAIDLYESVLRNEKEDRWLTYAHYGLGLIYFNLIGDQDKAKPHFEKAARLAPDDPDVLLRYSLTIKLDDSAKAAGLLRHALEINPYHGGVVNAYLENSWVRDNEEKKREALLALSERLKKADLTASARDRHSELGFFAEPIGRPDTPPAASTEPAPLFLPANGFQVTLATGTRWAREMDLGEGDVLALRKAVRGRFGGTMVLLDFNRDGKIDVLLLGAVVRDGKLGNLLLRNDGGGRFTDVTAAAGLDSPHASLGCAVADFDNDGWPDLFLTGIDGVRLFRNHRDGTFEDVTARAGLDKLDGVTLAAAFVDIDQDGNLDLLVCSWGKTPGQALTLLADPTKAGGEMRLFTNNGHAYPALTQNNQPPLEPSFVAVKPEVFGLSRAVAGLGIGDVDLDQDVDVIALTDGSPATLILNDRLLRFHHAELPEALNTKGTWNGALILDVDRDERSDLLLIGPKQPPLLLLHERAAGAVSAAKLYRPGKVRSPALIQAQALDLDLDGKTDVVGLSAERVPVWLQNDGERLVDTPSVIGGKEGWPGDLLAVAAADMDGDGLPDLLAWSQEKGLVLRTQRANERHGLYLQLNGQRRIHVASGGLPSRCNADGVATRVTAQTRDHWTGLEYGSLFAGLGQSRVPLVLGMGRHPQADVIRLRWPDNVWQAEFNIPTGELTRLEEVQRKESSCPLLFTWNGQHFVFVTDFLGAGTLGEMQPDGSHRQPRPEESVKIEAHQLHPRNGQLVLRIAEPMDEVTYLDRLQLLVVDHPERASVYPDERMATDGLQPTQDLLSFEEPIHPCRATNHRGKDVTAKLRARDRDTVDEFAWRSWVGFAEDHWVELDFGDRLKCIGPTDRLFLFAAGSVEYAYPESIWAAGQAGVAPLAPVLERKGADGKWQRLAEIGFPAGMPRVMSFDLTGKLAGNSAPLRIRTNLHVYWDQLYLARVVDRVALPAKAEEHRLFRVTSLKVTSARLEARGCVQEYSPDGKLPTIYDHDRIVPTPVNRLAGKLTRLGDVTELLRETDDRFVLIGPGDEAEVAFDATRLPALPSGWKRSYVLRTWGYCKDSGPFTATGSTVEPLPFRAMTSYPYGPKEKYPDTPLHREYLRHYNTRRVGP